ncbi:MAG: XdhC family protein [Halanaerobiales bacterium]
MNFNFYKELNNLTESSKEVLVGTVIKAEGKLSELKERKFALTKEKVIYSGANIEQNLKDVVNKIGKENILKMNNPELKSVELKDKGKVEIYFEPVTDNPRLVLFGAGHIANQVSKIASLMDFEITIIDDREKFLNKERFPEADHLIVKNYTDYIKEYKPAKNDYIVIITRGHQFDYDVLSGVIDTDCKYVGMIGSSKKIGEVFAKLREVDKVSEELLDTVYTPIGLDIGAQTTAEIAVAIIGEIVKVRRTKDE